MFLNRAYLCCCTLTWLNVWWIVGDVDVWCNENLWTIAVLNFNDISYTFSWCHFMTIVTALINYVFHCELPFVLTNAKCLRSLVLFFIMVVYTMVLVLRVNFLCYGRLVVTLANITAHWLNTPIKFQSSKPHITVSQPVKNIFLCYHSLTLSKAMSWVCTMRCNDYRIFYSIFTIESI